MTEMDRLLEEVKVIVKNRIYVEDYRVRMKSCKYDLINLIERWDKKWLIEILKELEYDYIERGGL